jgi:hypothetical protein
VVGREQVVDYGIAVFLFAGITQHLGHAVADFRFAGFTDLPESGYQPDLDAPPTTAEPTIAASLY